MRPCPHNRLTELPEDETKAAIRELLQLQFMQFWYGSSII